MVFDGRILEEYSPIESEHPAIEIIKGIGLPKWVEHDYRKGKPYRKYCIFNPQTEEEIWVNDAKKQLMREQ